MGSPDKDGGFATDRGGPAGVALGFEDLRARPGDHIGHFFETEDQWLEVARGFITSGVRAQHRCMYVMEEGDRRRRLLDALRVDGVDPEGDPVHFHAGLGDPDDLRELLREFVEAGDGPDDFVRWGGEMGWSMDRMADDRALLEWETACNVVEDLPVVFLCQYEISRFPGSTIFNALRTHPLCIVGRTIHRNPFFEDPEVVLRELEG